MFQGIRKAGIAAVAVTVASGVIAGVAATSTEAVTDAVPKTAVVATNDLTLRTAPKATVGAGVADEALTIPVGIAATSEQAGATPKGDVASTKLATIKLDPKPDVNTESRSSAGTSRSSERRSTKSTSSTAGSSGESDTAPAPASSRGQAVVNYAKAQLGKPYQYGGTGPSGFDCSGLTMMAYRSAGVKISRTSQSQYGDGPKISQANLQPGDLVFYRGLGHVAIYVGNGRIIHATHPGAPVRYEKLNNTMSYVGAVRPS